MRFLGLLFWIFSASEPLRNLEKCLESCSVFENEKDAYAKMVAALPVYEAGPISDTLSHRTSKERISMTLQLFTKCDFLAMLAKENVVRTITRYWRVRNHNVWEIVPEEFTFDDDSGNLLSHVRISRWCSFPQNTLSVNEAVSFYIKNYAHTWNSSMNDKECRNWISSILSDDVKVTDEQIHAFWIGRVLEKRVFGKRLASVCGPYCHRMYPNFSLKSFCAMANDKEQTFTFWDKVGYRNNKSEQTQQSMIHVRFDQYEKAFKMFSLEFAAFIPFNMEEPMPGPINQDVSEKQFEIMI